MNYPIGISLLLCFLLSVCTPLVQAQTTVQQFQQAQEAYSLGHFEEADSLLTLIAPSLTGSERIDAYKMLSLISLQLEDPERAELYAHKLVMLDPYYTAYDESPRFNDLIEQLKIGRSSFSTGSQQSESLEEVPVPFTLITDEMIRHSGARTISDLLLLYVPGMSIVAGSEDIIAMRGIHSMSQSSILVLLDGHRMNSYSLNSMPLDYRIDLDKVHQVEVLRGPASSLYGNVALSAVVNIITKRGNEINGSQLTLRAGSQGTMGASWYTGHGNLQGENMGWISLFRKEGEEYYDKGVKHYIDGYNDEPTFDLGARMRWDDLSIQISAQHAKKIPYWNFIQLGRTSSYDEYERANGEKPGWSRTDIRLNIDYQKNWGPLSLSANFYSSWERQQIYNVLADTINGDNLLLFSSLLGIANEIPSNKGLWVNITWETYSFGGSAALSYPYKMSGNMHGSLLTGFQFESLVPRTGSMEYGTDFGTSHQIDHQLFTSGNEKTFSTFVQAKHFFTQKMLFNGGLRYDHRVSFNDVKRDIFSPRLSLIWLPTSTLNVKASYSHSFVDAPYFYRSSQVGSFTQKSEDLLPEKSDAYQLGVTASWPHLHLKYESNVFFTSTSDLIHFTIADDKEIADDIQIGIQNTGTLKLFGLEEALEYKAPKTIAILNATWQRPVTISKELGSGSTIKNVPNLIAKLTLSQQLFDHKRAGEMWLRANLYAQSKSELSYFDLGEFVEIVAKFIDEINKATEGNPVYYDQAQIEEIYSRYEAQINQLKYQSTPQSAYATLNVGLYWQLFHRLQLSADIYNLLDRHYFIGGQLCYPVPQSGRSILFSASYKF